MCSVDAIKIRVNNTEYHIDHQDSVSKNETMLTVSDGESSSVSSLSQTAVESLPIIITGTLFIICIIILTASTIVTKKKKRQRIQKQNSIVESIINSGANIKIKKEIEDSFEEQRNMEILGEYQ